VAALLVGHWFLEGWISVVVEVNQVGFREQLGYFCFWVINAVVGVHAQQYFFLHCSPLFNVIDQVS